MCMYLCMILNEHFHDSVFSCLFFRKFDIWHVYFISYKIHVFTFFRLILGSFISV